MSRAAALLVIGLVFGGAIGFVIAAANGVTLDGHNHATDHAMDHSAQMGEEMAHDHSQLVEAGNPRPKLTIQAHPDPASGWNLHLNVENFAFTPAASGAAHVDGEGHAHLYVNGVKLARVYGPWFHIPNLPEGQVELLVTLNANDHRTIAAEGTPIEARLKVTNPSDGS